MTLPHDEPRCAHLAAGIARRLDMPVATLNGTLTAVTRAIVAILATHQNEDGSVTVPQALRPYMGVVEVLKPLGSSVG